MHKFSLGFLGVAVLAAAGAVIAAPYKPIMVKAGVQPIQNGKRVLAASAGSISAAATVTQIGRPLNRGDGGYDQPVLVNLNNCNRQRMLSCVPIAASDAGAATTLYMLDGSSVASPPPAFTALCTFLLGTYTTDLGQIDTKITAALNAPGVQALLVAP